MSETNQNQEPKQEPKGEKNQRRVLTDLADSVENFAIKTVEKVKKSLDDALSSRNTVLSVRVSDEANRKLSLLVAAGLFKSRSESAAFLIAEGIQKQESLFQRIDEKMSEIDKIRDELRRIINNSKENGN